MNTLRLILPLVVMLAAGCLLPACGSTSKDTGSIYRTVSDEPQRNSELARKHHDEALKLIEAGELDKAEVSLKRALQADVTFGPAHNNLGKVYFHQKKLYLAAWEFQYAAKLMPHHPEPKNNLGLVLEASGQLDAAVENLQEALKLAPDHPELIGNLARIRLRRGDEGPEIRDLLQQVVVKDTRPEWVDWAKHKLALMPESR
jgi:Flp pilus assembly protein TadD